MVSTKFLGVIVFMVIMTIQGIAQKVEIERAGVQDGALKSTYIREIKALGIPIKHLDFTYCWKDMDWPVLFRQFDQYFPDLETIELGSSFRIRDAVASMVAYHSLDVEDIKKPESQTAKQLVGLLEDDVEAQMVFKAFEEDPESFYAEGFAYLVIESREKDLEFRAFIAAAMKHAKASKKDLAMGIAYFAQAIFLERQQDFKGAEKSLLAHVKYFASTDSYYHYMGHWRLIEFYERTDQQAKQIAYYGKIFKTLQKEYKKTPSIDRFSYLNPMYKNLLHLEEFQLSEQVFLLIAEYHPDYVRWNDLYMFYYETVEAFLYDKKEYDEAYKWALRWLDNGVKYGANSEDLLWGFAYLAARFEGRKLYKKSIEITKKWLAYSQDNSFKDDEVLVLRYLNVYYRMDGNYLDAYKSIMASYKAAYAIKDRNAMEVARGGLNATYNDMDGIDAKTRSQILKYIQTEYKYYVTTEDYPMRAALEEQIQNLE